VIRVLVADDQALVRAGFRAILEAQEDLEVVGEAADGGDAVTIARAVRPDVVLMDVRMPGVDGIEATRRLGARSPTDLGELTERELEVLELIARGLANAEIAEQLFLIEATVRTHVSHIFAKLGLRDRVQAVVLAYETGLVQPGG